MSLDYAELLAASAFSFLEGASHPEELVAEAAALGHAAIGIADVNTVAGVVRAHVAAKDQKLRLLVGSRLVPADGSQMVCYPENRTGWGLLCRLLTRGKMRAVKGECKLSFADIVEHAQNQVFIVVPPVILDTPFRSWLQMAAVQLRGQIYVAAIRHYAGDDEVRLQNLLAIAQAAKVRLVAANDVLYHSPEKRALQDVMRCIRHGCRIDEAGYRLEPHAERHLKPPAEMARLFKRFPESIAAQNEILQRVKFSLEEISYEYPDEPVPPGLTPDQHLANLVWEGARRHYGDQIPEAVQTNLEKELRMIAQLEYARYFLTVEDIVRYARSEKILCQGRGSAANSAVCYMLGITSVDPAKADLLFERFISAERREPPDIDVDFEHERREDVIQYLYRRYGRERAAIAATVIHYRPKSAIRDVGKALGVKTNILDILSAQTWNPGDELWSKDCLVEAGLNTEDTLLQRTLMITRQLLHLPRHLSQHVGGFVLTRERLDETVPIGKGAMAERSFIEWDKDDIDALGMMKVDVLALGMLTCIRKCFSMLDITDLTEVPQDDPVVYDMLCNGDSLGVFQVESRAQMNMLPRLKPRKFYDLVIEVAIVRPGPIQGDMVHPYLRRRSGAEKSDFPLRKNNQPNELEAILKKTLGVPLFQEQAMRIAMVAATFSAEEANGLRRAMATFRNVGTIPKFRDLMVERMVDRGYERDFSQACFKQIEGFGSYGFPESHAASFALLVYISSWLKCHHPAAFAAALLNSQPMGFYAPAQIIRDAREHGVQVRGADVNASVWDCTLEDNAVRLGLRMIDGFHTAWSEKLIKLRGAGFKDFDALSRSGLPRAALEVLAAADALTSINFDRRIALWRIAGLESAPALPLLASQTHRHRTPDLPLMSEGEKVIADYRTTGFSLRAHPLQLLRVKLTQANILACAQATSMKDGSPVLLAGIVTVRQRPGTAKGTIFITIEDETGIANIIVWPSLVETYRNPIINASLLIVEGNLQRSEDNVSHIIATRLADRSRWIAQLDAPLSSHDPLPQRRPPGHPRQERVVRKSRDFH